MFVLEDRGIVRIRLLFVIVEESVQAPLVRAELMSMALDLTKVACDRFEVERTPVIGVTGDEALGTHSVRTSAFQVVVGGTHDANRLLLVKPLAVGRSVVLNGAINHNQSINQMSW